MAMSNNQMVNPISGQVRKSFAPPNLVGKKRMCDIVPRLVRLGLGICWARAVLKKKTHKLETNPSRPDRSIAIATNKNSRKFSAFDKFFSIVHSKSKPKASPRAVIYSHSCRDYIPNLWGVKIPWHP